MLGESLYINCQVVYGSEWLYNETSQLGLLRNVLLQPSSKLNRIMSRREQVEYVGLKKGKGRILVLDLNEYKSMYVDANRLLGLNFDYDST